MMDRKTKGELVYCMDFIMHHLNDEEACEPWLACGCPDGYYQDAAPPPSADYEDLDLSDEEFDEFLRLFTSILVREVKPSRKERQRCVLA